ncbi:MAG: hypothetical protein PHD19_06545 [Dechloromonas sp.]|nr:hypothetical protein [Dechloromonas sp.]
MDETANTNLKKRGRKPLGEKAMTAAEAKRRSRAKHASEGRAEFMLTLSGGKLAFIDQLAKVQGDTRSQVINALLDMAIAKMVNVAIEADHMFANGATDQEVETSLMKALATAPEPHLVQQYKEMLKIK